MNSNLEYDFVIEPVCGLTINIKNADSLFDFLKTFGFYIFFQIVLPESFFFFY
jgi:hypothetical protein